MNTVIRLSLLFSLTLVLIGLAGGKVYSQETVTPLLNEIMSSNSGTIQDEDMETADWIELYNPGSKPIDLTGYGLTDTVENPYQWVFPAVTLHPRQHKIVFASGKDRNPVVKHWETVIRQGDIFRYFEGVTEPPWDWMQNSFDDKSWAQGPSGFGFGDNDDETVISKKVVSVYVRKNFTVDDVANITRCFLHIDYDDGFIAFINGQEVARANLGSPGSTIPYYGVADTAIEAQMFVGGSPELFEIENIASLLVPGENTLAIQAQNTHLTSSDMSLIPFLTFEMEVPPENPVGTPDILSFSIPFLHTNFKINKLGETISLFDPLGNKVDEINTHSIPVDFTLGRQPDGADNWVLFASTTPGSENADEAFNGYAGTVSISKEEGFYESGIVISMATGSSTAEIHYTLDGTEPGRASPVYSSPLSINTSTVVHARSFEDNKLPGEIATRTYVIGEKPDSSITNYFITCDPADFDYLYDNYLLNDYMPATLSYNGQHWPDVGIRIRGDDSRSLEKKSLKMKSSTLFANGRETINFNAEYLDNTYVQQFLSSYLMRESGQPVFSTEYARLYLNGEFLGLYLNVENVDEDFLTLRNMDSKGNLYKATHDGATLSIYDDIYTCWEKKTNTDSDWSDLVQLHHDMNTVSDEDYYDFVLKTFDYEKMINIIAMNMLISNRSTYYHNYYLYHDINGTNKWMMLPWDLDKTIGIYDNTFPYQQSSNVKMPDNPFLERALLDPKIFYDIRQKVDELAETLFNSNRLFPIIDSLSVALRTSVAEDETDKLANVEAWLYYLKRKNVYIQERHDILKNQFAHWPRSFKADPTAKPFSDAITLTWHPSIDPDGDPVSYKIVYTSSDEFLESELNYIEDISDTTYTFAEMLPIGTYYWKVMAGDGDNWIEGYNSWNRMEVKNATDIPVIINGNVILTPDNSPFNISSDVTITPQSSLTVEAGTELIFSEGTSIICNGELSINGTEENPVYIRVSSSGRSWGALCFEDATATLSHCSIKNATSGRDPEKFPAAVSAVYSDVMLDTVSFDGGGKSIGINGGSLYVSNCVFAETDSEGHLAAENASCTISNSEFMYCGGTASIRMESPIESEISENTLHGSDHDGVKIMNGASDLTIRGNTIFECYGAGISISNSFGNIRFRYNLLRNCSTGIAVHKTPDINIEHQTFYENSIAVSASAGDETENDISVTVRNTIFSASLDEDISFDEHSSILVTYSLSDNTLLPGNGNITADPLFLMPGEGDFHLRQNSPAIDTGDPESEMDTDNTVADMGAFYYRIYNSAVIINEINYNSSDSINSDDWVELYNPYTIPIDLSGWVLRDENAENGFTFPDDTILEADSYIVLCRNSLSFNSIFPDVENVIGELPFGLSGQGDTIMLLDSSGAVVDSLVYDDKEPWPEECDGDGHSLSLINPARDNIQPQSWKASKGIGTPGEINDVYQPYDPTDITTPKRLLVEQNYPNPFKTETVIDYTLTVGQKVTVYVYNIYGQRVSSLVNKYQEAGNHSVLFDASHLSSGVYIYRIEAGSLHKSKKMVHIK